MPPPPLAAWRLADDPRDSGRVAAIARSTAIELSEDNRVVRSRDVAIVVDDDDDDDDDVENVDAPTTPDAVTTIRRAFNDRVDSTTTTTTTTTAPSATHVGLHGGSPVAKITTDASGKRVFALQRDGAVAAWRREMATEENDLGVSTTTWVEAATPPYAGAPPLVLRGFDGKTGGDAFACVVCESRTNGRDDENAASLRIATLSEDGDRGTRLTIRAIGGSDGDRVTASARYDDAIGLESRGGVDFWVTTKSGVAYRWNAASGRATARVDVRAAAAATTASGVDFATCVSHPDGELVCVDRDSGRAFAVSPALRKPSDDDEDDDKDARSVIREIGRWMADERETTTTTAAAMQSVRLSSVGVHGAFAWTATRDETTETWTIRARHARSGIVAAETVLPPLVPSQTSAMLHAEEAGFELINGGVSGMYACAHAPGMCPASYRLALCVPSALARVAEKVIDATTTTSSGDQLVAMDALLRDVRSYGASTEHLYRALVVARKEAETAPDAFKTKRSVAHPSIAADARVAASIVPALLLKARLSGRFDDIATARWNQAVEDAIGELTRGASASLDADFARDILRKDWDAMRKTTTTTTTTSTDDTDASKNEDEEHFLSLVREMEAERGEELPEYAWVGVRALRRMRGCKALQSFEDAVWRSTPLSSTTNGDDDDDDGIVRALVDLIDTEELSTASLARTTFAPFDATMHLLYRIAPTRALAFIDAKAKASKVSRRALARRAMFAMQSPREHLARFGDGAASNALVRAVARTLCAADLTRAGVYVALTFGGIYSVEGVTIEPRRDKTTLAGWSLARDVLERELERDDSSVTMDARRKIAAEAFALVAASFRTLVEDWNDMPMKQHAEDVDADIAAECALFVADIIHALFEDTEADAEDVVDPSGESTDAEASARARKAVRDAAEKHAATMSAVSAAVARGEDAPEHVDSLERLVVAVTDALRFERSE